MPGLSASVALPALRAYAQVESDGTTPNLNSGVTVTKPGAPAGTYLVDLPAGQGLAEDHVMVLVQINSSSIALGVTYQWVSETRIQVNTFDAATPDRADAKFDIFIFAPTTPSELD